MNIKIPGLRLFLISTLHLTAIGKKVSCKEIEDNLANGIASKLFGDYREEYENCGFSDSYLSNIDEYYKKWNNSISKSRKLYNQ